MGRYLTAVGEVLLAVSGENYWPPLGRTNWPLTAGYDAPRIAHFPAVLDDGRLRAGAEPREVQLAEASGTEGCCGALYFTVRREADQVVWENWRQTMPGSREPAPELSVYRFDASAYDAEIARAETDCSWSWRTRTIARLIKAGLIEQPELLSRWDADRGWISSGFDDPDTAVVTFWYAPGAGVWQTGTSRQSPQFRWVIPDDGTSPKAQAAALRRLAEEDPKSYARVCGGSRERTEELGFPCLATPGHQPRSHWHAVNRLLRRAALASHRPRPPEVWRYSN